MAHVTLSEIAPFIADGSPPALWMHHLSECEMEDVS